MRHRPLAVRKRRRNTGRPDDDASDIPFMSPAEEEETSSLDEVPDQQRPHPLQRIKWMRAFNLFNRFTTHL